MQEVCPYLVMLCTRGWSHSFLSVCRMPISRVCLSGECIHVLGLLPHETASFQCCNRMSSVLIVICYVIRYVYMYSCCILWTLIAWHFSIINLKLFSNTQSTSLLSALVASKPFVGYAYANTQQRQMAQCIQRPCLSTSNGV